MSLGPYHSSMRRLLVGALLLVASCGDSAAITFETLADGDIRAEVTSKDDPAAYEALRELLSDNRARWRARAPDRYRMEFQSLNYWECCAVLTVQVTPDGAEVVAVEGDPGGIITQYTMELLFRELQEAINQRASRISVRFEADDGSIRNLYVDWDLEVADEESGAEVLSLTPG